MTVIESITGVFDSMSEWLTGALSSVTELFYVPDTGLTLIGTLAIMGLSIAVVTMLIAVIRSFLRFQ